MTDEPTRSPATRSVALLADPGLPRRVADAIADGLAEDLQREVGGGVRWVVQVDQRTLPLTPDGEVPLIESAASLRRATGADHVVYLTDLPLYHLGEPIVCELSSEAAAALVSLPALGAVRLRARSRSLLVTVVASLVEGSARYPSPEAARPSLGRYGIARRAGDDDISYLTRRGPATAFLMLAGMVRNNRPGRLPVALSRALAAATATGAFGIFYPTIWNMADSMTARRLALISLAVVTAFSGWLIVHNRLWSRRSPIASRKETRLDNAATVITVAISVLMAYVLLYLVLLLGGFTVITPDYLESQLAHPVSVRDYLQLAWLASSLGLMAGALGSNFDSEGAIREATYSRRQRQRRQLAERSEEADGAEAVRGD